MIFYRNEAKNRLLSFTAVFQVGELAIDDVSKLIADTIAAIPMDRYNQEERLAISEMINRSSAIGRVITVISVEKTPTSAINFVYDKVQEAALGLQLNVHVTLVHPSGNTRENFTVR